MIEKRNITWKEVEGLSYNIANAIVESVIPNMDRPVPVRIYGIPRGGIYVALAVQGILKKGGHNAIVVEDGLTCDVAVDDLIDSGGTQSLFKSVVGKPFYALLDKRDKKSSFHGKWVAFPWERINNEGGPEQNITRVLEYLGEDPSREGLLETPKRVIKSYDTLYGGYDMKVEDHFKVFEDDSSDEMVVLKDIEFFSTCLAGSTFIETPKGRIPISRLQDGEFVYCWDEDKCGMTVARCVNPRVTGKNKRLYRVYSDKDTILCTGDHKFLTHTRGWVKAKELTPGDSIVALNKGAFLQTGNTPCCHVVWTGMSSAIPEHRLVYEAVNGTIKKDEHIHHIDKQPNNNAPENLTALNKSEHSRLHRLTDGPTGFALFTDEQRRKIRKVQTIGIKKSQTEEVRKKRSASVKAYWDALTPTEREARNHRVLLIEKTDWFEDVWCMDVPGYENFVANGMVVHNCEHHMLPFFGKAHIAYIPDGKVIGISKLARILEVYARRLQIQERLCQQVTGAIEKALSPKGAACVLEAQHFCMTSRGVQKQNSIMVTSSLTGEFRSHKEVRAEFMGLIGK